MYIHIIYIYETITASWWTTRLMDRTISYCSWLTQRREIVEHKKEGTPGENEKERTPGASWSARARDVHFAILDVYMSERVLSRPAQADRKQNALAQREKCILRLPSKPELFCGRLYNADRT